VRSKKNALAFILETHSTTWTSLANVCKFKRCGGKKNVSTTTIQTCQIYFVLKAAHSLVVKVFDSREICNFWILNLAQTGHQSEPVRKPAIRETQQQPKFLDPGIHPPASISASPTERHKEPCSFPRHLCKPTHNQKNNGREDERRR
jgi:hypothetical protein